MIAFLEKIIIAFKLHTEMKYERLLVLALKHLKIKDPSIYDIDRIAKCGECIRIRSKFMSKTFDRDIVRNCMLYLKDGFDLGEHKTLNDLNIFFRAILSMPLWKIIMIFIDKQNAYLKEREVE